MLWLLLSVAGLVVGKPTPYDSQPYIGSMRARQAFTTEANASSPVVDLGYSVYEGYLNATAELNVFKGIRFARPPTGNLRWQAPRAPLTSRNASAIPATEYAPQCPQSPDASFRVAATNETGASEDCLFLNVWSPSNVTGPLPVLVWIHGGGYGEGNGQDDLTPMINTNDNQFVGVAIQYRLGAFGFLSSDEVFRKGVVNAGLLDQHMALHWVQQYVHLFNGDPDRVTISGESAGAGSVMLQDMAYGGSLGSQLFRNTFAASPYLPTQYGYKDWIPSQAYYAFAAAVGCDSMKPYGADNTTATFECLLGVTSDKLINASATVSQEGLYGQWAFIPVTDGVFVQDTPTRQLGRGKVNGQNMLTGNNADEGWSFTPQNIDTEADLIAWLSLTFPLFSKNDIDKVLLYYPSSNASVNASAPFYATNGTTINPSVLNQSSSGTGQQARANLIYGETTFMCPSYWLAEAFSTRGLGNAYKYQFSVVPALHGNDVSAYFSWPGTSPYTYDFDVAFQKLFGNFIINDNPSISSAIANGVSLSATSNSTNATNPISDWPPYSIHAPYMINLNTTCGDQRLLDQYDGAHNITYCVGDGVENRISLVNAYTWEAGRGVRCDFWRAISENVPE